MELIIRDCTESSIMEESPRAMRRVLEESLDCQTQFINMELVMHKISNGWEESPKLRRGMPISLESQEEFEFTMSNFPAKDDLYEPTMEVAPADELFFRGQLLPLEHDPRLQLVHTLSGLRRGELHVEDALEYKYAVEEELSMKHAYAEAFPFAAPLDEEAFPLHRPGFQETVSLKSADAEGTCIQEGVTNNTRSYRSDGGMDGSKNDSRSSSFRSQQSSYWGSGEKDSRDSSSSSRCSNGSSQDGSLHGAERRAQQHNKAMANSRLMNSASDTTNNKAEHHGTAHQGKPPLIPSARAKKWSWKALFTGLRKASKVWVDDRGEGQAAQRDTGRQRKSVFGLIPAGQASRGVGRDESYHVGSGEMMRKGRQQQAASRGKGHGNEDYGGHVSSKYYMGSGGYRGYNYYEGSNGGRPGKEKARLGIIAWNARESWQKWVKRPFDRKLSNTHKHNMHTNEDLHHHHHHSFNLKAKSLSSTPLVKSPVRRADNVANTPEFYGAPSSKYANAGFAASCPASMRSSPHHSGVLAVVNKSPPPSSLHDLHTAIQGAIAHCKQSQTVNPP